MPNTRNFETNIIELSSLYPKYSVSRIIANKSEELLDMEIPADFSEALLDNNIEINLYSSADNSLIFADVIKNVSGSIFTETLQYTDNTLRKLLYIDFSKVTPKLLLPSGQYIVSLNFFQDELGSYDNRILKVNKISTSRTEVELKLTDVSKKQKLTDFATPKITVEYIRPTLLQIFNQTGSNDLNLPMSSVKIDSSSLYENFTSGSGQKLIEYNFDDDNGSLIGVNTIAQNILNEAYPIVLKTIEDMIVNSGSTSFTQTELEEYIVNAISNVYDKVISDQQINSSKYRFNLI